MTYPDTMVPISKLTYARLNPNKQAIFCFKFIDGLFYHVFDPKFEYRVAEGGRCDRGKPEINVYAFISNELLENLSSRFVFRKQALQGLQTVVAKLQ